jgi:protein TorT
MVRSAIPILIACCLFGGGLAAAERWFPADVVVWTPPFNTEGKTERQRYVPVERISRSWRLCAALPHLKDAYWLAVNYGLITEARRLELGIRITEAGGFDHLARQRQQVIQCMNDDADALVLAGATATGLNDLVAYYASTGKPVIDLITGIDSPAIAARAGADPAEAARAIGEYLKRLPGMRSKPTRIAWFPGPEDSLWSQAADRGLKEALKGSPIQIAAEAWGEDTGIPLLIRQVSAAIDRHPDLDAIVGTAVSAQAAIQELRRRALEGRIKVLSYQASPAIYRAMLRGSVLASVSDEPALQASLGIDLAVRALEKQLTVRHLAAPIRLLDAASVAGADLSYDVAPDGFRAIMTVGQ